MKNQLPRKRNVGVGATFLVLIAGLGAASALLSHKAVVQAAGAQAPRFEVDPMWPKPLPNHWLMGNVIGVSVDAQDHIWIIHSSASLEPKEVYATAKPAASECCFPAPPVLEFDEEGNLIGHWGGPGQGYDWPLRNHGITVDYKGNVWIGGNGRGEPPAAKAATKGAPLEENIGAGYFVDNQVLKFTQDGKFLMQIGKAGQSKGSNDLQNLK